MNFFLRSVRIAPYGANGGERVKISYSKVVLSFVKILFHGLLPHYEINIVKDVMEILTPFKWATDLTQGETKVTASIILPVIRGLRVQLETTHAKFNSSLTTTLKSSFEKRMSKYEQHEVFKLAAALDPRWKTDWCTQEESVELKSIILDKARSVSYSLGHRQILRWNRWSWNFLHLKRYQNSLNSWIKTTPAESHTVVIPYK